MTVYVIDYASWMESRSLGNDSLSTVLIDRADVVVNPTVACIIGKKVIYNLPTSGDEDTIKQLNSVISRFPIDDDIPVVPYDFPQNRQDCSKEDYSCLILNKDMMTSNKGIDYLTSNKFLVGIDETCNDEVTAIGQVILGTRFEEVLESAKQGPKPFK